MSAEKVVWRLEATQWMAWGDNPAVEITHLKIGAVKVETDRQGPNLNSPGYLEVWVAPTHKDVNGAWVEPPVQGSYFKIIGEEYDQFLQIPFPEGTDSFDDIERAVYMYIAATNRIPAGEVVVY